MMIINPSRSFDLDKNGLKFLGFGANNLQKVQRTEPTPFGALHLQTDT